MEDIIKTIGSWIAALCVAAIILMVCYVYRVLRPEENITKDSIECCSKKRHGSNIGVQLLTNPLYKWHPVNVYHH
jgi:hypothetical protein